MSPEESALAEISSPETSSPGSLIVVRGSQQWISFIFLLKNTLDNEQQLYDYSNNAQMKTVHEHVQMVRQRSAGPELSTTIMESLSHKPNVSFSILKVIFKTILIRNFSKIHVLVIVTLIVRLKLYSKETNTLYKSRSLLPRRLRYKLPILWKKFVTIALKKVREFGLEIKMGRM